MPATRMSDVPFSGIREVLSACDELEAAGRDVIHLEIGRPDFDTPRPIKDAAVRAINDGEVYYTSNYGLPALRAGLADKFRRENNVEYNSESEIVVTAGAAEALLVTFLALVDPGDEVLIPDPSFLYGPVIRLAHGTPIRYDLRSNAEFQPDLDALEAAISPRTSMIVMNSPHNPTGSVIDREHVTAIRDFVVEHDLLVLSDEIYEKILYEGTHWSPASLKGMRERTITINGFSKAYSMTGWRLGYLGAPKQLADPLIRARMYTSVCSSSISQHAGVRALCGDLHQPLVETFADRRALVMNRIQAIDGIELSNRPAGAFYALPQITIDGVDDREFALSLLHEAGVAVVPGSAFGEGGAGRVRIAYSNSTDRISAAFDRLEDWISSRS